MRRLLSITAVIAVLFMAGCGSSNLDKLNGVWKLDVTETLAAMGTKEDDPAMQMAKDLIAPLFGQMELIVDTKAKTLAIAGGEEPEVKSFTVVSEKGDSFVLNVAGGDTRLELKKKDNKEFLYLSDMAAEEQSLVFSRKE